MSSVFSNIFTINGVIDTSKNVMDNMNTLAAACSSWVTFDIHTGQWSVIVNEPGSSIASFTDSNIIGSISVSGSGLTELYNKVQLEFPHKDLNDQVDTITYEIPSGDRYPYEYDNTLNFKFDCINEPIQAEILAAIQLKQSRVDKVIQFRTDFSKLGIKAGDLIDVTSSMYGYSSKVFRVLTVTEEDADDHTIVISITAFEYDSNVYNTSGLIRTERTVSNGIISSCANTTLAASNQSANEASIMKLLVPLALSSLFNMMFPALNKKLFEALASPSCSVTGPDSICEGDTASYIAIVCSNGCSDLSSTQLDYTIDGIVSGNTNIPLKGKLNCDASGKATLSVPIIDGTITDDKTMKVTIGGKTKETVIHDKKRYSMVASSASITEGEGANITITTVGITDGTSIPFTISGSGVDQLSGTPTSGNVVINSNSAVINITTKDIDALADTGLSVSLGGGTYWCTSGSASITIIHTGTPPPQPPADTNCEWVSIPSVWCGSFDGTTGAVKSVFPIATVSVLKAISGQASISVPLTVTLSGNNIAVATSVDIDASTGKGGHLVNIITSFNAMTPGVKRVTGSTTQVIGY